MEKGGHKFNVNDWLEKPVKRIPNLKPSSATNDPGFWLASEPSTTEWGRRSLPYDRVLAEERIKYGKSEKPAVYEVNAEPMLFPQTVNPEYFMDNFQKSKLAVEGISKQAFEHFKQKALLDYNQLSDLLSVARNTLINKKGTETFDIYISEKLISLAEVYTHGFDVFGDEKAFISWLNTPNTALGMVTPFSMLQTQYGRQEVHHVLGRIEWGVYS